MKKNIKIAMIIISAIIITTVLGFAAYTASPMAAEEAAINANISDEHVSVNFEDGYITYEPAQPLGIGIVFYPGGLVEYDAYGALCRSIAEKGITVVDVKMPFNLAMFNKDAGIEIIEEYSEIDTWYLAGHSMGGAFGSFHLSEHYDLYDGMIFLGSYPAADISDIDLPILVLTGELDTVMNAERFEESKNYLSDAVYFEIEGGNHSQFGDYGFQSGDTEAEISSSEQKEIIVEQIIKFTGSSKAA